MTKAFERLVSWRNKELADLPQNAYAKVSLTRLDWATFVLVCCLALWKNIHESLPILDVWLGYMAGMHGFHYMNVRSAVNSPSTTPQGLQIPSDDVPAPPPTPVVSTTTTTTLTPPGASP